MDAGIDAKIDDAEMVVDIVNDSNNFLDIKTYEPPNLPNNISYIQIKDPEIIEEESETIKLNPYPTNFYRILNNQKNLDEETQRCNDELRDALNEHYHRRINIVKIASDTMKNNPLDRQLILQKISDVIKIYRQYNEIMELYLNSEHNQP